MLPGIREAFEAQTLQMYQEKPKMPCSYTAPCAVGAGLPVETRELLKSLIEETGIPGSIDGLWDAGFIVGEDLDALAELQILHDNAAMCAAYGDDTTEARRSFALKLTELEEHYA